MSHLEIRAEIATGKLTEFNQAKYSFYDSIQKEDGYKGYTENHCSHFCLILEFKDEQTLINTMQSEVYRIFHGAIITLCEKNSIHINVSNQQ